MRCKCVLPVPALVTALVTVSSLVLGPSASSGAVIITASETAGNVVLTGSGTLNLSALSLFDTATSDAPGGIQGVPPVAVLGPKSVSADVYIGELIPPASIGPLTSFRPADSGSGNFFGAEYLASGPPRTCITVPHLYTSGSALSGTSVFSGQTFSSLGITPGTYAWTWGSGAAADSLTLLVAVPEPAHLLLILAVVPTFCRRKDKRERQA
jgi:hypothetical protein